MRKQIKTLNEGVNFKVGDTYKIVKPFNYQFMDYDVGEYFTIAKVNVQGKYGEYVQTFLYSAEGEYLNLLNLPVEFLQDWLSNKTVVLKPKSTSSKKQSGVKW